MDEKITRRLIAFVLIAMHKVSCNDSVDEGDSYAEVYEPIDLSDRIRGVNLTKNKL